MLGEVFLAVKDHALLAGIEHLIGGECLDQRSAPPRIVWVPRHAAISSSPVLTKPSGPTPRPILAMHHEVRIRLWAKATGSDEPVDDIMAVEELARKVLVAIHEVARGSYTARDLEWLDVGSEQTQFGRAADLVVEFVTPVTRQPPTLVTITSVTAADMTGTAQLGTPATASPVP